MNKKSQLVILSLSLALLSACTTPGKRAPVVDRNGNETSRDDSRDRDPNSYVVKRGDTLIRIALEHGQNYRDLVAWNNLANPNDIKVDQVLRVTPPEGGAIARNDNNAASSPGVQTAAVLMPPATESRPPPAGSPAVPKKSSPRGDKRPYSDAAMAELQKADAGAVALASRPESKPDKGDMPPIPATGAAASSTTAASAGDDDKLSWMWPSDGKIIGTFDEGKNKGIDIAGKAGQQVMAAGSGRVMYAGSGIRGYGNLVIVKHSNSLLSAYAHNRNIVVKEGQNVNKGQMIAEMGDSDADMVKLHFEIRRQGKPVDPAKFLPNR